MEMKFKKSKYTRGIKITVTSFKRIASVVLFARANETPNSVRANTVVAAR